MRVKVARAHGVALAGVAAAAVVAGGLFFSESGGHGKGTVAVPPALAGPAPRWGDGYNHYIVTMSGPARLTARFKDAAAHGAPAPSAHDVQAAHAARAGAQAAPPRLARGGLMVEPVSSAAHHAAPRRSPHLVAAPASPGTTPANAGGGPWQSVAPNRNEPIVLRAGQPTTLLAKMLAKFPKGTRLVRDRDGNLRAVLPPGTHYGHYTGSASPGKAEAGGRPAAKKPAPSGTEPGKAARTVAPLPDQGSGGTGPGSRAHTHNTGLPPGWGPQSAKIAASLAKVPGVHAASPVWGDRYQVTTTLEASQLSDLGGVAAVAPNNLLTAMSLPGTNDPDVGLEYYLANDGQSVLGQAGTSGASADFSYAWDRSRGGGVVIADIDTGVDLANPDLSGHISAASENFSVSPPTSNVQAQGQADGYYHATTVDGVMVAKAGNGWGGAGAAPEARVLALKCGDSVTFTDSCIYAAGQYAIAQGVKVINMSFGEQQSSDPTLQTLISDAQAAGVLVTASAGNWGSDNDKSPVLPAGYATSYDNVISVGASDNQDNLASFSDYGASTVDLMAPGDNVYTDYPSYSGYQTAYASGTSYSAPLVAATAALLWSADSSLTDLQVKNDILSSVQAVPALAGKSVTGGRLDAQAALGLLGEPVQFTFTGFDQVQPTQTAQVAVNVTAQAGALPSGVPLGYHLELAYNYDGQMYDVQGQQINWALGSGSAQSATTSSSGGAFVAPSGVTSSNYGASTLNLGVPTPGLPSGTYALVAFAAADSSPTTPIGNPQAVFFNVGQASPTPPASTTTLVTTTTVAATTTTTGGTTTTLPSVTTTTAAGTTTTVPATTTTTAAGITTTTAAPTTTTLPADTTTTSAATTTTLPSVSTTTAAGTTTTSAAGATTTTSVPPTTSTTTGVTTTEGPIPSTTLGQEPPPVIGTTTTSVPPASTTTLAATTTTAVQSTTTAPFSVDSVAPNALPVSGGDLSIFGNNFPVNPVVMVGSVAAAVSNATSTEIDVMVGAMPAGNYSVTVYNALQTQSSSLPDAVTVGNGGGGSGTTTTAVTTTTAAPTTTTASPTTTAAPATTTTVALTTTSAAPVTTTTAATTTTTALGPVTTTTGPGGSIVGPDGMVLSPVSSTDPLSNVSVGEWPAFTASQLIANNGQSSGTAVDGVDV